MIGVAGLSLCAAAAQTPSLSELARQAELQRAAKSADDLFANRHLAGASMAGSTEAADLRLTMALVQRMFEAWDAGLRAQIQDVVMARRYLTASSRAKNYEEDERAIAAEPALVQSIRQHSMTVHEFVVTRLAYTLAESVRDHRYPPGLLDFGNIGPNVKLLSDHASDVQAAARGHQKLDRQLSEAVAVASASGNR